MSCATMISSASKEMVQYLKEVVNCSEEEIYAMLKECNMDPTETVHRLLNQDTFHEVKSKRKQKKETKDGPESRTQSVNNYHAQSGARGGRSSSSYYSTIDYGTGYGKPVHKNEREMNVTGNSSSCMSTPTLYSEATSIQNKRQSHTTIDNDAPSLSQPPGFQNNRSKSVVPGQMSMADIVRLGISQIKPSTITTDAIPIKTSISQTKEPPIISTPQELVDPGVHNKEKSQCSFHNDWISITHAEISSVDPPAFSTLHIDETSKFERESYLDEIQIHRGGNEDSQTESSRSESSYDEETISRDSGDRDDSPFSGIDSYDSHREEVEDANLKLSSANANLHQPDLPEEIFGITASTEDKPAVIIPSHLQVTCADLSHLSFGSFRSNRNNNLDTAAITDKTKFDQLNSRNTGHYDNDQLKTTIDDKATNTRSYNIPSVSQPEFGDETHDIRGNFLSSSDYAFPSTTKSSPACNYSDLSVQMQNLNPFPTLMQPRSNSMPSSILSTNSHHPLQEHDLPFPALQKVQSISTQYDTSIPSFSLPNFMSEQVETDVLSSTRPTEKTLPNSNIHDPSLTQLLHNSQQSLPSGHPFLPQDCAYLAQFLQSQAAAEAAATKYRNELAQYKYGISGSNLAQSAAIPLGYGGCTGAANNTMGNIILDPSTTLDYTAAGIADALGSHYKDGSHYVPVQHNNESAMWLEQALLRSSLQGQQSTPSAFRQAPPQYSSLMEHLNLYQPQGGPTQQQYRQNLKGGNMSGSQCRMWQDRY